jgi:plastocyanin
MRGRTGLVAGMGAAVLGLTLVSSAGASSTGLTVHTSGTNSMVRNGFIQSSLHFQPGTTVVHQGQTVTWTEEGVADQQEPHTISVVAVADEPKNIMDVFNCGAPGTICDRIFKAQDRHLVVDVGRPGLDEPGDSLFLRAGKTIRFKVTAPKGSVLRYMCGIHPWMQGLIVVQ